MLISVIPIGNSKGIRIPKSVLEQLKIGEKVEMEVRETELLIKPARRLPREGWETAFREMAERAEDRPLIPDYLEDETSDWEW